LAICIGLSLAACGGGGGGLGGSVDGDNAKPPPPRPEDNAITETLVQASGAQQAAAGGLIENDTIVGEGFAAGSVGTAGAVTVRHGFAPPLLPDWPRGIASNAPSAERRQEGRP
jgi:hypothetical protein